MRILRCASKEQLAYDAAVAGADRIRFALHKRGRATIVLATGLSQELMLDYLYRENLDWSRVTAYHLDEYVGIRPNHPGSFRKFLKERFVDHVSLKAFHMIAAEKNPVTEIRRLNKLLGDQTIDVVFCGIGENGHLAFNDPPADFRTDSPYILVKLDKACRRQQVKEGWFGTLLQVPNKAISMSIQQMLVADTIICSVPDLRKAKAVKAAVEGEITPKVPASILQQHARAFLYTDPESASLLGPSKRPMILQVASPEEAPTPLASGLNRFHLFAGGDWRKYSERDLSQFAQRAVGSGAVTVTAWGPGSFALKLAFEGESVRRAVASAVGRSADRQFTTVCYKPDDVDKALYFFLDTSKDFARACESWVALLVGNVSHRERIGEALGDPGAFMDDHIQNANDTRTPR